MINLKEKQEILYVAYKEFSDRSINRKEIFSEEKISDLVESFFEKDFVNLSKKEKDILHTTIKNDCLEGSNSYLTSLEVLNEYRLTDKKNANYLSRVNFNSNEIRHSKNISDLVERINDSKFESSDRFKKIKDLFENLSFSIKSNSIKQSGSTVENKAFGVLRFIDKMLGGVLNIKPEKKDLYDIACDKVKELSNKRYRTKTEKLLNKRLQQHILNRLEYKTINVESLNNDISDSIKYLGLDSEKGFKQVKSEIKEITFPELIKLTKSSSLKFANSNQTPKQIKKNEKLMSQLTNYEQFFKSSLSITEAQVLRDIKENFGLIENKNDFEKPDLKRKNKL